MNSTWPKWVFAIASAYDGLLGVTFLFLWSWPYRYFGIEPPNHPGYVQFSALLLVIFAFLFLRIARDPAANRDLIPYGIALKASYSGLVFWYQLTTGVPSMWIPFAWLDVVFLTLFVLARQNIVSPRAQAVRG